MKNIVRKGDLVYIFENDRSEEQIHFIDRTNNVVRNMPSIKENNTTFMEMFKKYILESYLWVNEKYLNVKYPNVQSAV